MKYLRDSDIVVGYLHALSYSRERAFNVRAEKTLLPILNVFRKKIRTDGTSKLIVKLNEGLKSEYETRQYPDSTPLEQIDPYDVFYNGYVESMLNVKAVHLRFDFAAFERASEAEKDAMLKAKLVEGFEITAETFGFELPPLFYEAVGATETA